ncbi:hypothetical protein TrVFT333_005562 [Trichoderma virens FT-333]|nr:hypothetical protein TrVFT333_005562 [Trichoderma virens FT-333]
MKTLSFAAVSVLVLGASALNRIDCDRSIPASDCFCAQVVCPAGAPTFWHGTPTPTSRSTHPPPTPLPVYKQCCCCDPSISKIVCSLRPAEDCFCLAVACPPDAKTIFVKETPAPTS